MGRLGIDRPASPNRTGKEISKRIAALPNNRQGLPGVLVVLNLNEHDCSVVGLRRCLRWRLRWCLRSATTPTTHDVRVNDPSAPHPHLHELRSEVTRSPMGRTQIPNTIRYQTFIRIRTLPGCGRRRVRAGHENPRRHVVDCCFVDVVRSRSLRSGLYNLHLLW